jgi:hypothetical protein
LRKALDENRLSPIILISIKIMAIKINARWRTMEFYDRIEELEILERNRGPRPERA